MTNKLLFHPVVHRGLASVFAFALLFTMAAEYAGAAAIQPTDSQKEIAVGIAAASRPAEASALHRNDWSSGLAVAILDEGTSREAKDPSAAEALFRVAQDVAAKIGDSRVKALAMSKLGALLSHELAFPEAISLLRDALAAQTGDSETDAQPAAETAVGLALALTNSGQNEDGVTVAARAIELATAAGDEFTLGRAYSVAGTAATWTGNHRAAISYLQKALAAAEKLKSLSGQAAVLNNLGLASRQVFDYDGAAGYFERSLAVKRQQGPTAHVAVTLNNLGELELVQDHFDGAEKYFRLALEAVHNASEDNVRSFALINLGLIAQARGDFNKAIDSFEQGMAVAEKTGDVGTLSLTHLFEAAADVQLHQLADAQTNIDKARQKSADSGDSRVSMRLSMAQGDVYRDQGFKDKARSEYLNAIREFEALRLNVAGDESTQADYADNTRYVYTSLIRLDVSTGQNADAFHYAELSKSRVLLDDLISGRAEMARLLTPEETQRNKDLLTRLATLNLRLRSAEGADRRQTSQLIDKIRFDYSSFRTEVYAAHPELALRRADPEPVSVARAAALLPDEHSAFISYSIGDNASYAFVVTRVAGRAVLHVHELKTDEDKLGTRAAKWRSQIAARELGFTTLSREIYDTLLKPLQADLAGPNGKIERLIISPDGPLWQIPFEALQDSTGKFLTETCEVSYVPSATVLDRMRSVSASRTGPLSMLALGDPAGDLPEAAAEVAEIGKLYAASRRRVFTGSAATEAALRANAGRYSIIHIASHGMYDDARPLYSFLTLAPPSEKAAAGKGADNDGNLEAREIMDLHLTAKLVILSGCETARGSGTGMGIAGMSWALFIAGAPSTVASLWKVDSRSTAILMTALHKGLTLGETTSRALRDAKLTLLRNPAYRHPFYWGGFIGMGAVN